jgi:hypothetical protein
MAAESLLVFPDSQARDISIRPRLSIISALNQQTLPFAASTSMSSASVHESCYTNRMKPIQSHSSADRPQSGTRNSITRSRHAALEAPGKADSRVEQIWSIGLRTSLVLLLFLLLRSLYLCLHRCILTCRAHATHRPGLQPILRTALSPLLYEYPATASPAHPKPISNHSAAATGLVI